MRRALILSSICTTAWFGVGSAHALGFGTTTSPSLLGQRLDFSARVHLSSDESLLRECIKAAVFAGDYRLGADQVRVSLRPGNDPDERVVRVTTLRPIDEPVVTVDLTIGCSAQVSRKFVAFLDPPVLDLARSGAPEMRPAEPEPRFESQVSPLFAIASDPSTWHGDAPASRPAARKANRTRHAGLTGPRVAHPVRVAAAEQASKPAERRSAGGTRPAPAAPGGSRLQLETAGPAQAQRPTAAASAAAALPLASAAPQAAVDPASDQLQAMLAQEREHVRVLESGLAKLRSDAQSTRQSVTALQSRLHQAEADRFANPLNYVLGGLCVLLVAATGFALRRPKRGASRWFDPTQQPRIHDAAIEAESDDAVAVAAPQARTSTFARFDPVSASLARDKAVAKSIGGLEVTTVLDHAHVPRAADGESAAPAAGAANERASQESPMEVLIDLEQQVEFFAVLGQDDAAIDLLSAHVDSEGAVSPLPFFKLLEIHRRRDDEAGYRDIAAAFYQRFGTFAPTWEAGFGPGRALVDYPVTVERLQKLWATPAEAMQALDAWLFRRQPADDAFDLAAYRDLLFLYSIVREFAEEKRADQVDLMLPMDEPSVDLPLPVARSSQFAVLHPRASRPAPLDFDLSLSAQFRDSELRKAI